jgi:hypothetical protein
MPPAVNVVTAREEQFTDVLESAVSLTERPAPAWSPEQAYDVRPQACASSFQTPSRFPNVYARVPVRMTDWPLITIVRVPDMTTYADEPSTFQKPIS